MCASLQYVVVMISDKCNCNIIISLSSQLYYLRLYFTINMDTTCRVRTSADDEHKWYMYQLGWDRNKARTVVYAQLGHNNKYHCFSGNRACQFPPARQFFNNGHATVFSPSMRFYLRSQCLESTFRYLL